MDKLTIEIELTNAAFDDPYGHLEVMRIINRMQSYIDDVGIDNQQSKPFRDINGNTVARLEIE